MRRFLKYMLISLVVLIFLYCARAHIFAPIIQKYIHSKTGYTIQFDNFYISSSKLTVKNLKMDNVATADEVTFKIAPLRFFTHIISPINCISKVKISKLEIFLDTDTKKQGATSSLKANKTKSLSFVSFLNSEITIDIDVATIKKKYELAKIIGTNIIINHDKIILDSTLYIADVPIKVNSQSTMTSENLFNTTLFFDAKNKADISVKAEGTINFASFDTMQNITIEKLKYNGFSLSGSTCSFFKSSGEYNISLTGNFGDFKFYCSSNSITTQAKSRIDISKINRGLCGDLRLDFKGQNNIGKLELSIADLIVFGVKKGTFNLLGEKNSDGAYNISCIYGSDKKMEIVYASSGKYEGKLVANNKVVGIAKGDIKTGAISADMKNVNISDIPLIPFIDRSAKGVVNISGSIDEVDGQIDFSCKNFRNSGMNSANIVGSIVRNNDMYVLNFYKDDNSIAFNSVLKNQKIISVDLKFVGIDIANAMLLCGRSDWNISGMANGRVKYEKDSLTEFDIRAFNGTLYNNKFKKFEAKGNMSLSRVNIERFIVVNNSNEILANITGILGFAQANPISSICVNLKNINIGAANISGYTEFHGQIDKNNEINGVVRSTGVFVSGVPLGIISADVIASMKKLEISDLKSDSGIKALLSANFKENKLLGNIDFTNVNIQGVYPNISGLFNSSIRLSGEISNPNIKILASVMDGKYFDLPFSLLADVEYIDGVADIKKSIIAVNNSNIILRGKYLDGEEFLLTVNNLDEKIINTFVGFRTPLQGNFSGKGTISVKDGKCNCKMILNTKTVYIKAVKFNDVKSNIEINSDNISISNASAKISDSEIRVDNGFFNIKNKKYGLDVFLVNVHAGPIDIFGGVKLQGEMTKEKYISLYNGKIDLNNLWINKYRLSPSCFNYTIKDRKLEFFKRDDEAVAYNASGLIVFEDVISVMKLNIEKDNRFFNLSADFSKNFLNLDIKSSNMDWHFITDVLNFPSYLDGNADINVNLSGKIDNIKGNMTIISTSGSLMSVPYDSFNLEMNLHDNRAYIKRASAYKRNEICILVRGDFPFYLDKTLCNKIEQETVNVVYEISDFKLNILKYLLDGYIKPYSGKMSLNGSFTGTYEKLSGNAKFSIVGGGFESNDYLNKIKDANVEISLVDKLIKIDKFSFKSGVGKLNAYGQARLKNFSIEDFDIRFVTDKKGISLRIPQLPLSSFIRSESLLKDYSSGEPSFDIRVQGTPTKPKISGKIRLENTRFTYPGSENNKDSLIPEATEFDIELATAKNTVYQNSYISALINGYLHINGTYDNLKTNGIIETSSGIMVDHLGARFDISKAKIEIIDDKQVYITASGVTSMPSKNGGKSEKMEVIVNRSKMSELFNPDIIKVVSKDDSNVDSRKAIKKNLGVEQDNFITTLQSGGHFNFAMKQQTLRLFGQKFAIPLTEVILRKIGLADNLKISYDEAYDVGLDNKNASIATLLSGTKISLEKNLTSQILLGFSATCFCDWRRDWRHEVAMRYELANNLFLSLFLNGSYGYEDEKSPYQFDQKAMLQYQFRFGPSTIKKINKA
ncbi:MAG: translocation/assembly module TamB domain-containing protein [Endomicrobium sp.]|nr:translocation/assembly module TamB domain-containing protein [Endomicrobium sp.]